MAFIFLHTTALPRVLVAAFARTFVVVTVNAGQLKLYFFYYFMLVLRHIICFSDKLFFLIFFGCTQLPDRTLSRTKFFNDRFDTPAGGRQEHTQIFINFHYFCRVLLSTAHTFFYFILSFAYAGRRSACHWLFDALDSIIGYCVLLLVFPFFCLLLGVVIYAGRHFTLDSRNQVVLFVF